MQGGAGDRGWGRRKKFVFRLYLSSTLLLAGEHAKQGPKQWGCLHFSSPCASAGRFVGYGTQSHRTCIEGCTLGFGVGPGEARPVLVMLQDPFLLADGGVLQKAPGPAPAAVLCFRAVWNRPAGRPRPEREDASDTELSSASSLDCADTAGLHHRKAVMDASVAPVLSKKPSAKHVLSVRHRCNRSAQFTLLRTALYGIDAVGQGWGLQHDVRLIEAWGGGGTSMGWI